MRREVEMEGVVEALLGILRDPPKVDKRRGDEVDGRNVWDGRPVRMQLPVEVGTTGREGRDVSLCCRPRRRHERRATPTHM